jgi:drug/metabolite transporter (DMT)-like permease
MRTDRIIPVVVAALGVATAGVGVATTGRPVLGAGAVVAGVAAFGGGVVWYRRRRARAEEVTVDERIEALAYRSGDLAFRVSLALGMLLFLGVEAAAVPMTARQGLVLLLLGMVAARFGLYGWLTRPPA